MEQHEELTMNTTPAFADNLAQLRATHNMTQEQLAEHLGVSRQSVSKWESGVCLPELATLDTLCSLFDCTLDNLLRGSVAQADLAALEAYDAGWNRFAKAITFGTAMVLLGVAASGFALSFGLGERTAGVVMFLFLIVGVVCIIASGIQFEAFSKKNTAAAVVYPESRRAPFDERFPWYMAGGVGGILADVVLMMLLTQWLDDMMSGSVFMLVLTVCVSVLVWAGMQRGKLDEPDEARRKRDDPDYAHRQESVGRIAGVLWILAVAVFLVWSFLFDAWKISWLTFVVAALLTGAVGAAFSREVDD